MNVIVERMFPVCLKQIRQNGMVLFDSFVFHK